MAVITTTSNFFKKQMMDGQVNIRGEIFRAHLMNTTFAFDEDAHARWDEVSGEEISATGGYSSVDVSGELSQDNTNDRARTDFGNITFTASGDAFDATGGAILRRTVGSGEVLENIDFGTDHTIGAGNAIQLQSVILNQN